MDDCCSGGPVTMFGLPSMLAVVKVEVEGKVEVAVAAATPTPSGRCSRFSRARRF